jgi:hypothetical protein
LAIGHPTIAKTSQLPSILRAFCKHDLATFSNSPRKNRVLGALSTPKTYFFVNLAKSYVNMTFTVCVSSPSSSQFLLTMVDSHTSVLLLQSEQFQGLVWKTVLQSQRIAVIWEAPDTDLKSALTQIADAQLTLPNVLIVDVKCLADAPYAFCRWCNQHYPSIQVVLTDHQKPEISDPEREWAIAQGAADFILGFRKENFVGSGILCARRVFDLLLSDQMNAGQLMSVLLDLEREHFAPPQVSPASANGNSGQTNGNTNGTNGQATVQPVITWRGRRVRGAAPASPAPSSPPTPEPTPETPPKPKLRYRGRTY